MTVPPKTWGRRTRREAWPTVVGKRLQIVPELGRYDRCARGRGGIGIHAGFRCRCSEEYEGSSPSARTLAVSTYRIYG